MAVQQLFVQQQSALKGFVLSLVPDFADADDVLQEVFVTVTRKAGDFELGSNFNAWARSIARLKVLEHWRRQKNKADALAEDVIESLHASAPEELFSPEQRRALEQCLEKLPASSREIVELRYRREHKPAEIARLKGWGANGVSVALSRARATLRECVERQVKLMEETA